MTQRLGHVLSHSAVVKGVAEQGSGSSRFDYFEHLTRGWTELCSTTVHMRGNRKRADAAWWRKFATLIK